jgi:hypothetical protein
VLKDQSRSPIVASRSAPAFIDTTPVGAGHGINCSFVLVELVHVRGVSIRSL